jgi:hypothetical protein
MKLVSFLGWLSCVSTLRSTFAFSVAPASFSAAQTSPSKLGNSVRTPLRSTASKSALNVASSVEAEAVAKMERGVGGRIEEAFALSKERGEAAFITFVTAGYPTAAGKLRCNEIFKDPSKMSACFPGSSPCLSL